MKRFLLPLAVLAAALALPASAPAQDYVPGEVIVKYEGEVSSQPLAIEEGESVREAVEELQADPKVAYARPNYIAHAAAFVPNDPSIGLQWNLFGPLGLNMPEAWDLATALGAPGGRGAVVAVLDTGVAYRRRGPFRRAPDLHHFVKGYDFVDEDRFPFDLNGHGTHVAGTIAQSTNNSKGVAGIAYRAEIMPLRVLDADGAGDTVAISRAIRYAAKRRADVINLSLEFDSSVRASQIPDIVSALRFARRRGVVVVGRGREPGRRRRGLPGAHVLGDRGRRHDRARLPGRLLQRRSRPRRRGARRRGGRARAARRRRAQRVGRRRLRPERSPARTSSSRPSPATCAASASRAATRGPRWPPPTWRASPRF